jgi:hypothetical protein
MSNKNFRKWLREQEQKRLGAWFYVSALVMGWAAVGQLLFRHH